MIPRSSRPEVFFKKSVLKNLTSLQEDARVGVSLKRDSKTGVELCEIFKNNFFRTSKVRLLCRTYTFIHSHFPPKHFNLASFIHILEED